MVSGVESRSAPEPGPHSMMKEGVILVSTTVMLAELNLHLAALLFVMTLTIGALVVLLFVGYTQDAARSFLTLRRDARQAEARVRAEAQRGIAELESYLNPRDALS